mgnify:CR=1 FL=1
MYSQAVKLSNSCSTVRVSLSPLVYDAFNLLKSGDVHVNPGPTNLHVSPSSSVDRPPLRLPATGHVAISSRIKIPASRCNPVLGITLRHGWT